MMRMQPLELSDFSGGITDNYVDAPLNCYQRGDNFFITTNKKLFSRPGSRLNDDTYYQSPKGVQRVGTLINYDQDYLLLQHVGQSLYYIDAGFQEIVGPTGNHVFPVDNFDTKIAHAQWNRHLFLTNETYATVQKIYRDNNGDMQVRTAGMPPLASAPVVTAGAAGANNYLYRFIYHFTYFVDTVEYQDFGPTTEVLLSNAAAPNINAVAITAIPVLANGATQNYAVAAVKVKIYRTENNGDQNFYFVGEVTNGTTTFNDNTSDPNLVLNEELYTNGGVVDNDPPPLCKYLHITDGKCYYASIKEGTEELETQVRQSIRDDLDSVPVDFFTSVEEPIRGISSVRGIPVILCKKNIYRIDGEFDELGRGGMTYQKINDTAGCVSHNSIVQTMDGIFWAGNDGFYYSDGFKVQKISESFNNTYKTLVQSEGQKKNITGVYEEENNRIIWAVQTDTSSMENDTWFVLDLRWGIRAESSFTTCSGGTSFAPSALTIFDKKIIRGDKRGYVFRHDTEFLTDPRVDTFKVPSLWGFETIIWDYRSPQMSFGSSFVRKWSPKISVSAKNETDLSLQIISNNDDNRQVLPLGPIRFRGNILWGAIEPVWGDEACIWNDTRIIDEIRRMPAKSLRFDYKQIQMTNAFVNISNSDTLGNVNIVAGVTPFDANLAYVTFVDTVNFDWPDESVNYFLAFENDSYVAEYQVVARTDDMLTIVDPTGTAPEGTNKAWILRGKPKNEIFHLLAYVIHFQMQSDTQRSFDFGDSGANA